MPIDTSTALSPGWWLARLLKDLDSRQEGLNRLDRYYRGDPDLPEGAAGHRAAYRQFQRKSRTNFAELIVEAVRERMVPAGFRSGATGTEQTDTEAWRIWQANSLDADSALVHRAQLSLSDAYVIVGPVDPEIGAPVITPEDPRQVITAHDPVRRRRVVAALKAFQDNVAGLDRAYVYLPGVVAQAVRRSGQTWSWDLDGWEWLNAQQVDPRLGVPVVRFPNRWDLSGSVMGEFEDVLDVLDRINHMLLQRVLIATMQAFRQRAVKGDLPSHDAEGNEIDYAAMFPADPGALWQLPDGVDLWESNQADLTPILTSVRHDVQDLAAKTRTPLFYLTPDASNGSAEGASLAREGLVFKTSDRIAQAGESWEQVMALAFLQSGREAPPDIEVLWQPPERFSLAERYDAAVKASAAGVPWATVMRDVLQFTPQQVLRLEAERATDAFLSTPEPAVPVAPALTQ